MIADSLDMMQRLDAAAMAAQACEPDPNLKHFDHQLWRLIYKVGQTHPEVAARTFSLSPSTVAFICQRPENDMQILASGALLSFTTLATPEQISTALNANINPGVFFEDTSQHDADLAYWNLMARCGYRDPLKSTQTFGVQSSVIEAVTNSTDAHLRHLAKTVQEGFKLRFDEQLIPEILNNRTLTMAHITRFIQSLGGGLK